MKNYFTYLIKNNKNIILFIAVLFLLLHSFITISFQFTYLNVDMEVFDCRILSIGAILLLLILVYVFPLVLHKQYLKTSSADMYYALAMRKETQSLIHVAYGWTIVFVPFLVSCVINLLLIQTSMEVRMQYMLYYVLMLVVASALYLWNTYLVFKCNSQKDALIVLAMYFFIFFIVWIRLYAFVSANTFAFIPGFMEAKLNHLSLFTMLFSPIAIFTSSNITQFLATDAWIIIAAYFIYNIIFALLVYRAAKAKQAEDVGAITNAKITYPFALSAIVVILLLTSLNGYSTTMTIASLYIFLFIAYIGVNLIAQRDFKIKVRHILMFVLSIVISFAIRFVYIESDAFNLALQYKNITPTQYQMIHFYDYDTTLGGLQIEVTKENREVVYKAIGEVQDYLYDEFKKESKSIVKLQSYEAGTIDIGVKKNKKDKYWYNYTLSLNNKTVGGVIQIFDKYGLFQ